MKRSHPVFAVRPAGSSSGQPWRSLPSALAVSV